MAVPTKDYRAWKLPRTAWKTPRDFGDADAITDGVHSIELESGLCLDLYIRGNPFGQGHDAALLVFFAGAVTGRSSKSGPFFSGLGLAGNLDIPVIAVADPSLDRDQELSLAWYTGGPADRLQDGIAQILDMIAARAGRELLLVGGSGGGFAALLFASRLGQRCSAFVWNAQTDVLLYSPPFTKRYLRSVMGFSSQALASVSWIEESRQRLSGRVVTDLFGAPGLDAPRRLFYLQNASDWHVQQHLVPWLRDNDQYGHRGTGRYAADDQHVVLVAHAAEGHVPPPTPLLEAVIASLSNPDATAMDAANVVLASEPVSGQDTSCLPELGT